MSTLSAPSQSVNPACTCSEDEPCGLCREEFSEWARSLPFPDPEPEPTSQDRYEDEPAELPESVYHTNRTIRVGTIGQLTGSKVLLAGDGPKTPVYVEESEGGVVIDYTAFLDLTAARQYAASLFGEGGWSEEEDDPFEDQTYSELGYWLEFADPTEDEERMEAEARAEMNARAELEWGR